MEDFRELVISRLATSWSLTVLRTRDIDRTLVSEQRLGGSDMSDLAAKRCVPCEGGVPPLRGEELDELRKQLGGGWKVVDEHHLEKAFAFKDFRQALEFTNQLGELAEEQGHHPDIHLSYGEARVEIWTHKIDGLTESDFVLAAKADRLPAASGE